MTFIVHYNWMSATARLLSSQVADIQRGLAGSWQAANQSNTQRISETVNVDFQLRKCTHLKQIHDPAPSRLSDKTSNNFTLLTFACLFDSALSLSTSWLGGWGGGGEW